MSESKIVPYLHPAEIEAIYGVRVAPRLCECDLVKEKLAIAVEALEFAEGARYRADNLPEAARSNRDRLRSVNAKARAALEKLRGEK